MDSTMKFYEMRKRKVLLTAALRRFVGSNSIGYVGFAAAADRLAAIVLHRLAIEDHCAGRFILACLSIPSERFLQCRARNVAAGQHDGVVIASARRTFERFSHWF